MAILPIDVNGNGKVDPEEDFYDNTADLIKAIDEGRFPSPPARYLYLVTKGKPTRPVVVEFLKFIVTEGQQYANETGYIALSEEQMKTEQEKLN